MTRKINKNNTASVGTQTTCFLDRSNHTFPSTINKDDSVNLSDFFKCVTNECETKESGQPSHKKTNSHVHTVYHLRNVQPQFSTKKIKTRKVKLSFRPETGYHTNIHSTVNDFSCQPLLDSGATCSILPLNMLHNFKHSQLNETADLFTFSNEQISVHGIYNVLFLLDGFGIIKQRTLVVSDEHTQPILGVDVLRKTRASLCYDNKEDTHYMSFPLSYIANKLTITPAIDVLLNPKSIGLIRCYFTTSAKVEKGQLLSTEPTKYTMPCLIEIDQVNKNGFGANILCVNSTDDSVILPKLPIAASFQNTRLSYFPDKLDEVKLKMYKVNDDWFDNLSSFAPIFSNQNAKESINKSTDNNLSDLIEKMNEGAVERSSPIVRECVYAAVFNCVYSEARPPVSPTADEKVSTLVEGGDKSGGVPYAPPPEPIRQQLVRDQIEKLDVKPDIKNILLNNTSALSASKWDPGSTKFPVSFDFDKEYTRESKIYKCSGEKLQFLQEQLNILCMNNFIERVNSNYGLAAFVVGSKAKNNLRLVFDCKVSNTFIKNGAKHRTFLPETTTIVEKISDTAQFITKMDLSKCYWSFELSKDIKESGFSQILTQVGCFKSHRAITGWNTLPLFLQHYLEFYLHTDSEGQYSPLSSNLCSFFDDVNLFSTQAMGRAGHLLDLDSTLKRISRSGLRINISKSEWAIDLTKQSIQVLGYEISYQKIGPIPGKLEALSKIPLPNTLLRLQRFLGMLVYYRKFLSLNISGAISKLYTYCSPNKFDNSNSEYKKAFKQVIENLTTNSVVRPSPQSLNILFTDSSSYCAGAVLVNLESATFSRRRFKSPTFHGYISQDLQCRLNQATDWTNQLQVGCSDKDIFNCLFSGLQWVGDTHSDVNNLRESVLCQVYRNMREHSAIFPYSANKKRHVFNHIFHSLESAECTLSSDYEPFLTSAMLIELSRLVNRQIIVINNSKAGYFCIGKPYQKAPLLVYQSRDLYYGLYNEKPFLQYPSSLHKSVDTLQENEILPLLEKCFNNSKDAPLIKPVGFFTRNLSAAEKKRPVWVLELMAIEAALDFFSTEINSTRSLVLSDSLPSISLLKSKKYVLHINPILLKLSTHFPSVGYIYIKGKLNAAADFFSRPDQPGDNLQAHHVKYPKFETDQLAFFDNYDDLLKSHLITDHAEQVSSCRINNLRLCNSSQQAFFENELSQLSFYKHSIADPPAPLSDYESFVGGYKNIHTGKIFLPDALQFAMIAKAHLEFGHVGFKKIINYILYFFDITKRTVLVDRIKHYVDNCLGCILSKPNSITYEKGAIFNDLKLDFASAISIDLMEFHQMDFKSPSTLKSGKVLVIVDHVTKYISTFLIKLGTDEEILRALVTWFSANRIPSVILSDNATAMKSAQVFRVAKSLGVRIMRSSPRNSKSRGRVENAIKKLRNQIRLLRVSLPEISPQILISIATPLVNSANFMDENFSPKLQRDLCLFNRFPFLQNHDHVAESCHDIRRKLNKEIKKVREKHVNKQKQKLKRLNKGRVDSSSFTVGDFVVVKSYSSNKSHPLFSSELYVVKKVYGHSLLLNRLIDGFLTVRTFQQCKKIVKNPSNCKIPANLVPHVDLVRFEDNLPKLDAKLLETKVISTEPSTVLTRSKKRLADLEALDELEEIQHLNSTSKQKSVRFNA